MVEWLYLNWTTHDLPATVHAAADYTMEVGGGKSDSGKRGGFVGLAPRKGGDGHTVDYDIISFDGEGGGDGGDGPRLTHARSPNALYTLHSLPAVRCLCYR